MSFRDVDVEQIGYICEGLLGYSRALVEDQVVLGLVIHVFVGVATSPLSAG